MIFVVANRELQFQRARTWKVVALRYDRHTSFEVSAPNIRRLLGESRRSRPTRRIEKGQSKFAEYLLPALQQHCQDRAARRQRTYRPCHSDGSVLLTRVRRSNSLAWDD